VEPENPSACATVNRKLCKSAKALYLSVIYTDSVTEVLINPIIRTRTRHFRHAYHLQVTIYFVVIQNYALLWYLNLNCNVISDNSLELSL
jgi:hypothetical protein